MRYDLPAAKWRKSSYSNGGTGSCVETQLTHDGLVAMGDSKDRARGAFVFAPATWTSFVDHVKKTAS
ncbi:DUF397 domain-containing protein [Streptomyces sp. DSM 44915]|uniref:DUF397 domain-containing protein n=1 Tax=Streptomyces chisholmiae TaxID=3075540 RepID=A0ABU2JQ98_9ACTN|nr:DUF397 domain-containing protein [Streptomyces sp. DSM 44915]MDT0266901.1 DUF397 domain-containing protein [Streptomyces sp. DSM 44915]